MSKRVFKADVVVFVHAAKRKLATRIVEKFAAAIEDERDLAFRFVSSSDDTGETSVPDLEVGKPG